mgnify:CR=1 FL=1
MASHEYDPDDNFGHAFHAQSGIDDDDALEAVAWQFLLLVNPDDEDAALQQFAAFQRALDEAGERADGEAHGGRDQVVLEGVLHEEGHAEEEREPAEPGEAFA